ncbi:MAG TPA: ABC-2 family transporter protein [Anaerolineales bacterium]|jgi:ABC-2 type transport system permease protein|nr:ABC-2 family transporter protein [Anaerolineales bacterium]
MNILRLVWTFLRVGILNEMQYRVNFFIQLLQSFIALGVGLVGLTLVFSHTTDLGGWSRPELLAVMGVHILMGGVINAIIQPNMQTLMGDIQEGTLDYALTKPADLQVIVSVREFRLWQLVDVIMGIVVMGWAVEELQEGIGLWSALGFSAAILMGAMMIYCFWLMLTTTAFWVVRVHEMVNLFQGVYAAGRWPVGIYPDWLRSTLTFLVPVAFAVTIPAEALTGRLTPLTLAGAAALTIFFAFLARGVWVLGVRNYSGASA